MTFEILRVNNTLCLSSLKNSALELAYSKLLTGGTCSLNKQAIFLAKSLGSSALAILANVKLFPTTSGSPPASVTTTGSPA